MRDISATVPELYLCRKSHGAALLLLLIAAGGAIYFFAGSGAWVLSGNRRAFVGFCADTAFLLELFPGLSGGHAVLTAVFAHHFFYPLAATLLVGHAVTTMCSGRHWLLSRARGLSAKQRYGRSLLIVVALSGIYSVGLSVFALAINVSVGDVDLGGFAMRMLFFTVVDASFSVVCFSLCLILNSRIAANVLMLCATYALLIISMAHPAIFYPSHMAIWMHACGFGGPGYWVESLLFSLTSACISVAAARFAVSFRSKSL